MTGSRGLGTDLGTKRCLTSVWVGTQFHGLHTGLALACTLETLATTRRCGRLVYGPVASTVTSRNTATQNRRTLRSGVTTSSNIHRSSEPVFAGRIRGSSPVSCTHFHRRLSATELVDDASRHEAALRRGRAGRRALFARCPPRALPAYPAFHADHRRTGAARSTQDRRPTPPRRRSPSATSVPEPATRAAEL